MTDSDTEKGGLFRFIKEAEEMGGQKEKELVDKLESVADQSGGVVVFNEAEAEVLRRVIKFVRGLEALGWLGRGLKAVLIWLGAILILWSQIGSWLKAYLLNGH